MDKIRGDLETRIEEIGTKFEQDKRSVIDFGKKTEQIIQALNDEALGELHKIYTQALFNSEHSNGTYWISKSKFEEIKKLVDERGQELGGLKVSELPKNFAENIRDFRLNNALYKEVFPSVDLFNVFMQDGIIWPTKHAREGAFKQGYSTVIVIPSNLDTGERDFPRTGYFEGFFEREFGSKPFYFSEKSRNYDLAKSPLPLRTDKKKFYSMAVRPARDMVSDEFLKDTIGQDQKTIKDFIARANQLSGFGMMSWTSIQGLKLGEYIMFLLNDYINNGKNDDSDKRRYSFPDSDIYCNLIPEGYEEGRRDDKVEKKLVAKWDDSRKSVELVGELSHLSVGKTGTRLAYKFHV